MLSLGDPQKAIYADPEYTYSEEELEVFKILTIDTSYNATIMNELKCVEKNLAAVREMKFPDSVSVLSFVAKENCEMFPEWEKLHRDVIGNMDISKMVLLEGGHYLHFSCKDTLVINIIDQIKIEE